MNEAARVVLVEELDALGAAPADARARRTALRHAGVSAALAVLESADAPWRHTATPPEPSRDDATTFTDDDAGRRALQRWLRERDDALVLWASAGAARTARSFDLRGDVRWWPTGLGTTPADVPSMLRHVPARGAHDPFEWNLVEPDKLQRVRLSLWDGPYVLAPVPLQGRAGEAALEAFASVAADRDAIDLVVLAHSQPGFEKLAHRLGVGMRVHFVGPAPREAEIAWLQNAAAAVVAGADPLACGLPLRTMACGCPPLVADGGAAALAAWCRARLGDWCAPGDAAALADRLAAALGGANEVKLLRERARDVARGYTVSALATKLPRALPDAGRSVRRHAA